MCVQRGSIVAASGLKSTQTGDTLLLSPSSGCNEMRLPGLITPTLVFFTAIETESASQQTALDEAIRCICLEDPSITVRQDANTGQQLLGGMGELHLQVVIDRLKREHKLELYTGAMQVAYMEGVCGDVTNESSHSATPGGPEEIEVTLAIKPAKGVGWAGSGGDGSDGGGEAESAPVRCGATQNVKDFLQLRELKAAFEGLEGGGNVRRVAWCILYTAYVRHYSLCGGQRVSALMLYGHAVRRYLSRLLRRRLYCWSR